LKKPLRVIFHNLKKWLRFLFLSVQNGVVKHLEGSGERGSTIHLREFLRKKAKKMSMKRKRMEAIYPCLTITYHSTIDSERKGVGILGIVFSLLNCFACKRLEGIKP